MEAKLIRKKGKWKEETMNERASVNQPEGSKQNTRQEFEQRMAENSELAATVKSLSYTVNCYLFGAKPTEESPSKEKQEDARQQVVPFFNKMGGLIVETRVYLREAREALEEMIKELK